MIQDISAIPSLVQWEKIISAEAARRPDSSLKFYFSVYTDSGDYRQSCKIIPRPVESTQKMLIARYCAACVNNLAMTHGGTTVEVACTDLELANTVIRVIDCTYPQVREILGEFFEQEIQIRAVKRPTRQKTGGVKKNFCRRNGPNCAKDKAAVGMNIGQTDIKVSVIKDGCLVPAANQKYPTWPPEHGKNFQTLYRHILKILAHTSKEFKLEGILIGTGFSIGGIVRRGKITSKSGVTLNWTENDFNHFQDLPNRIEKHYGITSFIMQDVVAKGVDILARDPLVETVLLDIGTSTGGLYIDSNGHLPELLNQIGRVVLDPSNDAIPRSDGKAAGVISNYLSAKGARRIFTRLGIRFDRPHELDELVASGDPRITLAAKEMVRILAESIRLLTEFYRFKNIALSGGVIGSRFGRMIVEQVEFGLANLDLTDKKIRISDQPVFEGSIGAARQVYDEYADIKWLQAVVKKEIRSRQTTTFPREFADDGYLPGQLIMGSEAGKSHYVDYNIRFLNRFISDIAEAVRLSASLKAALGRVFSDINRIDNLTPQQVQSIAVDSVARVTGVADPFVRWKRQWNAAVSKSLDSLMNSNGRNRRGGRWGKKSWKPELFRLLKIAGAINEVDYFNQDKIDLILKYGPNSKKSAGPAASDLLNDNLMEHWLNMPVVCDDSAIFFDLLEKNPGAGLLYFLDNPGEAVADLGVIKYLLSLGFKVDIVAHALPFVDDMTCEDVKKLVFTDSLLSNEFETGTIGVLEVSSDMTGLGNEFIAAFSRAKAYIAKGIRRLNFLFRQEVRLAGLHIAFYKSATLENIMQRERGIHKPELRRGSVAFIFRTNSGPDR